MLHSTATSHHSRPEPARLHRAGRPRGAALPARPPAESPFSQPPSLRSRLSRVLWLALLAAASSIAPPPIAAQANPATERPPPSPAGSKSAARQWIFGAVIEQRKYSLLIARGEDDLVVELPDGVPIAQRLDRPQLDLERGVLTQEIVGSQVAGGKWGQLVEIAEPLPQPLALRAEFAHLSERRRLLGSSPRRLVRYTLLAAGQESPARSDPDLELRGIVRAVAADGLVTLEAGGESLQVELGTRDARLGGRSIADLRPGETAVEILAESISGRWVAQEVIYRRVPPLRPVDRPAPRPIRVLVLGDEISLSYLAALREALGERFEVCHPPENCRGSAAWSRLPLWLGAYRQPDQQWDWILFNFGAADLTTPEPDYAAALQTAIDQLRPTKARLVWLTTTPLPGNWEFKGPAAEPLSRSGAETKLARLGAVAAEVLALSPGVDRIDLAAHVLAERSLRLGPWWAGGDAGFAHESGRVVVEPLVAHLGPSADR